MMARTKNLSIAGYRGEPVPNRFLRRDGETDHLAILLPGFGYTCDMPLLYYAEHLLTDGGADVLRVEYAYSQRPEFRRLSTAEQAAWLLADATAAYRAGLAQRGYRAVTLVGKSLGTLAMGHLLTTEDRPAEEVRAVWLTPVIGEGRLREQIARYGGPSLFVIGTADPYYDTTRLAELRAATGGEAVVVDGADHGMDISGDAVASVAALERVVRALHAFLSPRADR